jgi:hypothetical protein
MRRIVTALFLFGISFGYVEAAVVVYLRAIYQPIRTSIHADLGPNDLFPLITPQQLAATGPENTRRLAIEIVREAATMAMLASVALAVASDFHAWFAAFAVVFGVWDIAFYAFLRIMIHWPQSLTTWDILFLIPLPWVGPVWSPVVVALSMIVCGLIALQRGVRARLRDAAIILAGAVIIITAFVWDFRNTSSGGMPNAFNWPLFFAGEIVGLIGFASALAAPKYQESQKELDS